MEVTTSPTASTSPTSSDPNRSATQLGCGRSIDDVWGNAENPPTTHEMGCPYCRAARSDLAGLRKATRDLHQQDTTDTDLQAGPGVLDRILAIARAEVRRGRGLPLDRVRPGRASDLTVSEQTVTALIRRAGDRTEHIQIRRCAIEVVDDANDRSADTGSIKRSRSGSEPAGVKVSLQVSVGKAAAILSAVEELRQTIIDVVSRQVGLAATRVDVTVEDIHDA